MSLLSKELAKEIFVGVPALSREAFNSKSPAEVMAIFVGTSAAHYIKMGVALTVLAKALRLVKPLLKSDAGEKIERKMRSTACLRGLFKFSDRPAYCAMHWLGNRLVDAALYMPWCRNNAVSKKFFPSWQHACMFMNCGFLSRFAWFLPTSSYPRLTRDFAYELDSSMTPYERLELDFPGWMRPRVAEFVYKLYEHAVGENSQSLKRDTYEFASQSVLFYGTLNGVAWIATKLGWGGGDFKYSMLSLGALGVVGIVNGIANTFVFPPPLPDLTPDQQEEILRETFLSDMLPALRELEPAQLEQIEQLRDTVVVGRMTHNERLEALRFFRQVHFFREAIESGEMPHGVMESLSDFTRQVSVSMFDAPGKESAKTCAVCLDEFAKSDANKPVALACGHVFHTKCIQEWLQGHKRCPTCRSEVKKDDDDDAFDPMAFVEKQRALKWRESRVLPVRMEYGDWDDVVNFCRLRGVLDEVTLNSFEAPSDANVFVDLPIGFVLLTLDVYPDELF